MSTDFTVIVSAGGDKKQNKKLPLTLLFIFFMFSFVLLEIKEYFLSFVCEIGNIVPYLFAQE